MVFITVSYLIESMSCLITTINGLTLSTETGAFTEIVEIILMKNFFQDFKKHQRMVEGTNATVVDADVDPDDDESGVDVNDVEEAGDVDEAQGINFTNIFCMPFFNESVLL